MSDTREYIVERLRDERREGMKGQCPEGCQVVEFSIYPGGALVSWMGGDGRMRSADVRAATLRDALNFWGGVCGRTVLHYVSEERLRKIDWRVWKRM